MSRLGLIALDGVYLAAGFALLHALGLARARRSFLRLGGLAFVLGWSIVGGVCSYLLVLGAAATIPQTLAATALVLASVCPLAARARTSATAEAAWRPLSSPLSRISCTALCAYVALLLWRSLVSGLTWWDSWAFWVPKGMSIVYFGGLDTGPGGFTSFANADYPPLVPALHALGLRFVGDIDPPALVLQDWVLAAAFLWALAGLLAPRVDARIVWPSLLLLAVVPNFGRQVGALTGDLPLAIVFAVAGVAGMLWRLERVPAHGVVFATLLAAVPLVKKEGLFSAVVLVLVLAVATSRPVSRDALRVAALALVPVAAVLPWRIWLRVHDLRVRGDYDPAKLLDPGFLADRAGRLADTVQEVPWYFLNPNLWLLALPVALAAALLARRSAPQVSRFVIGMTIASFVGVVVIYWISFLNLDYHLGSSAARVPTPTILLAVALLPLMLASLQREPG